MQTLRDGESLFAAAANLRCAVEPLDSDPRSELPSQAASLFDQYRERKASL